MFAMVAQFVDLCLLFLYGFGENRDQFDIVNGLHHIDGIPLPSTRNRAFCCCQPVQALLFYIHYTENRNAYFFLNGLNALYFFVC